MLFFLVDGARVSIHLVFSFLESIAYAVLGFWAF